MKGVSQVELNNDGTKKRAFATTVTIYQTDGRIGFTPDWRDVESAALLQVDQFANDWLKAKDERKKQ
jgi:hypothetical protein